MWWWAGIAALVVAAGGLAAAQPGPEIAAPPIDVMVLGTYHFANPGRDIHNTKVDDALKPRRQRELEALAVALAEYRPTKIMVERVPPTADLKDPFYARLTPAEFATNRNERVQIGYRLARRLGHQTVYAIDEQPGPGEPDYFPFDAVVQWAKANGAEPRLNALLADGAKLSRRTEQLQRVSIPHALAEINRPAATRNDQRFYYELLALGDANKQPGADLNAMWYLRNAKIFAKLRLAATPGDRVLVVYGSGHNYWLRHFADTAPGFRNVDPVPYLERAAAKLR